MRSSASAVHGGEPGPCAWGLEREASGMGLVAPSLIWRIVAAGPSMLGCASPIAGDLIMANRFISAVRRLAANMAELMEFQQRIWVVSILHEAYTDTFIVNEGSFDEPMQWMIRKGYDAEMLRRVDKMRRSQAIELALDGTHHRLMRVK